MLTEETTTTPKHPHHTHVAGTTDHTTFDMREQNVGTQLNTAQEATPAPIDITGEHVKYVLSSGRNKGEIRPAFVVRAWSNGAFPAANLQVLTDGLNDFEHGQNGAGGLMWATSVSYSSEKTPGTWHR